MVPVKRVPREVGDWMTIRDAGKNAKAFAAALEQKRLEAAARDASEAACPECVELRARIAELERDAQESTDMYRRARDRADEAKAAPACDVCAGKKVLLDGSTCVCGDGTMHGLALALRFRIGEEGIRADKAEARADHLGEALRVYGRHKAVCGALRIVERHGHHGEVVFGKCDCGLDAALARRQEGAR